MPHILPEERGPPASCSEVAPPAPSAPSGPRGRSPPVIPGARGETPGGSAAQRARRPARLPLERERDGEAGGSSPAGSRGGRSPRSASRGFPARRPLHRTWPDNGNEGERQGEGNTSSLQTSCRMSRLGAGWRRDPRSSDYPARTFDAWHTDTHSRRRRRRSEARAPPHPAVPPPGGHGWSPHVSPGCCGSAHAAAAAALALSGARSRRASEEVTASRGGGCGGRGRWRKNRGGRRRAGRGCRGKGRKG